MTDRWSLEGAFGPVSREAWRAQVERELKGKPYEKLIARIDQGIEVPPLITAEDWPQSPRAHTGTQGWESRVHISHTDPDKAREAALEALEGGAHGIVVHASVLASLLEHLPSERTTVALHTGTDLPSDLPWTHTLVALELGLDPIGALAATGTPDEGAMTRLVEAAAQASKQPNTRAVRVDTGVYHDAGADEIQDLALAIATGLTYLRAMEAGGLALDTAFDQIVFHVRVESAFFTAIAKLRALRLLWGRIAQACGVSNPTSPVWVSPAARIWTRRDPWVNMLRNTACTFAAATAGADAITSLPYDDAITAEPSTLGRRVARNTPTILSRESHLDQVRDPAAGAWYIENLTDKLTAHAWTLFQDLESQGGVEASLRSGHVQAQIKAAVQTRNTLISKRKRSITGVSAFPNIHEPSPSALPADPIATDTEFEALRPVRLAEPFEALRDRSDALLDATGTRPRVFSANLGPVAQHTARATFAQNLLEAGGFEVVSSPPLDTPESISEAFGASGAKTAVICSSDRLYDTLAVISCDALKGSGARRIVLAGRPGKLEAPLTEAGLTNTLYMGCDALALLADLWAATVEDLP